MDSFVGVKLFVGGLPEQACSDDICKAFSGYSQVLKAKVQISHYLRKSRGFGYATIKDPSAVDEILSSNIFVLGQKVDVKVAKGSNHRATIKLIPLPTPLTISSYSMIPPKCAARTGSKLCKDGRTIISVINYDSGGVSNYVNKHTLATHEPSNKFAKMEGKQQISSSLLRHNWNQSDENYRFNHQISTTRTQERAFL